MGKYVPDRDFIFGTEKLLREAIHEYNDNIHDFEKKNIKIAGKKARRAILKIKKLLPIRRNEINARIKKLYYRVHKDGILY
jgi:hypothetical protein